MRAKMGRESAVGAQLGLEGVPGLTHQIYRQYTETRYMRGIYGVQVHEGRISDKDKDVKTRTEKKTEAEATRMTEPGGQRRR